MLPLIYSKQELSEVKSTRAGSVTLQQYLNSVAVQKANESFLVLSFINFFPIDKIHVYVFQIG